MTYLSLICKYLLSLLNQSMTEDCDTGNVTSSTFSLVSFFSLMQFSAVLKVNIAAIPVKTSQQSRTVAGCTFPLGKAATCARFGLSVWECWTFYYGN